MATKRKPNPAPVSQALEPCREVRLPGRNRPVKVRTAIAYLDGDGGVAAVVFDVDREASYGFRVRPPTYATVRRLPLDDAVAWAWNAAADGRLL